MTNDRIRASDADRERIADRLREHYAEGRLTREELDERIAAALGARTYGDLRAVMTDLPEPGMVSPPGFFQQPGGWPVPLQPRPVFVRTGPPLLPLLFLFLFLTVLLPGVGWMYAGFIQVFLLFAFAAAASAIVASVARRRSRRDRPDQQGQGYYYRPGQYVRQGRFDRQGQAGYYGTWPSGHMR